MLKKERRPGRSHEGKVQPDQSQLGETDSSGIRRLVRQGSGTIQTAEAHTFLGWTYHFQGRLEDAIAECKRAIEIDPDFGNPYNDIGAYMIEQGNLDQAIPWLQQAIDSKRYEPRHFPHYNLGRAYLGKEMYSQAMRCFQEALEIEPRYGLARQALDSLRRMLN